jgi:hypothetical protein
MAKIIEATAKKMKQTNTISTLVTVNTLASDSIGWDPEDVTFPTSV